MSCFIRWIASFFMHQITFSSINSILYTFSLSKKKKKCRESDCLKIYYNVKRYSALHCVIIIIIIWNLITELHWGQMYFGNCGMALLLNSKAICSNKYFICQVDAHTSRKRKKNWISQSCSWMIIIFLYLPCQTSIYILLIHCISNN